MFEETEELTNKINPESLNPNEIKRNSTPKPKIEIEDTPEFRKSLNMAVSG